MQPELVLFFFFFFLDPNIIVSRGGCEKEEREQEVHGQNHNDSTNYYIIPFVIKTGKIKLYREMGKLGGGGGGFHVPKGNSQAPRDAQVFLHDK